MVPKWSTDEKQALVDLLGKPIQIEKLPGDKLNLEQ